MKAILRIILLSLVLLTACSSGKATLQDELAGRWVDGEGFIIEFHEDGTGFIPGVAGAIPDSSFTYEIVDESKVQLSYGGDTFDIEIEIADNQLTWKDQLGEVVYTRVEE